MVSSYGCSVGEMAAAAAVERRRVWERSEWRRMPADRILEAIFVCCRVVGLVRL